MRIVGFGGKARSGKGTAARLLREIARANDYMAAPMAFAWPVKARRAAMENYSHWEVLAKPPHVRAAFQEEGTEKGRDVFGDDFWVRQLDYNIAMLVDEEPSLDIISIVDARFPNELDYIKDRGGITAWIESDRGGLDGVAGTHRSEVSVESANFDYVINNNKDITLEALNDQMIGIFGKLFASKPK